MAKASDRSRSDADAGPSRERLRGALGELVRAADGGVGAARDEGSLRSTLGGMTATVMRLVVLAYAEAQALVPGGEARSLGAQHAELEARARAGEALEARTGAWGRVDAALRGCLDEGASVAGRVSDATTLQVLDGVLTGEDGTRVRYEELEVEPIGGAYQGLVGLELRAARGATMLLLPEHVAVDLEALLAAPSAARAARLEELTDRASGARLGAALASAETVDALQRALARRASPRWPVVSRGALYLAPGEARRRAGAHYTPRALTRPLVARALAPLLAGLDV